MAITTSAMAGVIVTTAAVNETIPAQTNVADSTIEVEVADDIATSSNGNLESSPTYVGRTIILRQGLSNEETRFIVAEAASGVGNTFILEVSEPWVVDPVGSTDTIHVSYIIQDVATVNGLTLVNKTVQDFSSSRRLTIGTGTATFAYLNFLNGVGLQTVDNSSTTVADVTVDTDGRLDHGYIAFGTAIAGAKIQFAPAVDGELGLEVLSGGELNVYATWWDSVFRTLVDINTSTTTKIRIVNLETSFNINDFIIGAEDTDINGMIFTNDNTGTTPRIRVRALASGNEIKNVTFNGFDGLESNTSGDDPVIRNSLFTNMSKLVTIATAEIWNLVNSIMSIGTANQTDVSIAGTGELQRTFSFDFFVHDLADVAQTAKVYIVDLVHRGGSASLDFELTADSGGLASADVEVERYVDDSGTALTLTTSSNFAEIAAEYGLLPVIKNIEPENEDETTTPVKFGKTIDYALSPDVFQVQATAATARTLGDTTNTVAIENQTNAATLFKFTGGSGVDPSIGDTIGNDSDAAEGVFVSLIEGDFVAGTMLLDSRNATAWPTAAHTLDDAASGGNWTATFDTGFGVKSFTWLIDVDTLTGQELYDYLNAKLDEASLDTSTPTFFDTILFWAVDGTNALPVVGESVGANNKFKTVSETIKNEGWMVYNSGDATTGTPSLTNWQEFQSDDDSIYTPAATVTLTITVVEAEDFVTAVVGARVGIHRVSDNSEIVNDVTNGSGVVSASFAYTVDVAVFVKVRQETEDYPKIPATITASGLTQTIAVADDDIYTPT